MGSPKRRLFFAWTLPAEVHNGVAELQDRLKSQNPGWRWTAHEKLHVTLRFLGNTDEELLAPLSERVAALFKETPEFTVDVRDLGAFPQKSNARVLWLGLQDKTGVLQNLSRRLERRIEEFGFQKEPRPFRPHLTLAHLKPPQNVAEVIRLHSKEAEFGSCKISELILFESKLESASSRYIPLVRFALRKS